MVRQDLSADSPYADAVVHGDGLISLQYRRVRSGPTLEVKAPVNSAAWIKLDAPETYSHFRSLTARTPAWRRR